MRCERKLSDDVALLRIRRASLHMRGMPRPCTRAVHRKQGFSFRHVRRNTFVAFILESVMTRRLIAGIAVFVAVIGLMLVEGPSEAHAGWRRGCAKRCHGGGHHARCHGGWRAKRAHRCHGAHGGCNGAYTGCGGSYATGCSGSHAVGYGSAAPAPVPYEGRDDRDGAVPPPPAGDPSAAPAAPAPSQPSAPETATGPAA